MRGLLEPLVPLIEFRHRSWVTEDELADTLRFLERHGLAFVSVDSPPPRATNVVPTIAAATHPLAYVRFHGRNWRTWNIRNAKSSAERFDHLYTERSSPSGSSRSGGSRARPRRSTRSSTTTATTSRRGARRILRGLLDEAGLPAAGGLEPAADAQLDLGV